MKLFAPYAALLFLAAMPAQAQLWQRLTNPDIEVVLTHPPTLGIKIARVAFAPVSDHHADELVSACIVDLTGSGQLEILDRGNIEKVLKEQKFSNSGLVDSDSAIELGKLLGAGVLLFVKVHNLKSTQTPLSRTTSAWTDGKGKQHPAVTTYTSKTQVDFSASIQAVDLASGKIFSQRRITAAPSREVSSDQGQPEFPAETEVREMAIGQASTEVHRMLLSWTEPRKLIFYDDKDYGMKEAYKRLQIKDYSGALMKSMEALSQAKTDHGANAKYLGRTNYNVGMCQFILGDYDAAAPYLMAARETDPENKIFKESAEECDRAIKLREEMSKVDSRSAKVELELPGKASGASPSAAPPMKGPSIEERLERLDKLKQKGLLSPEEYKQRKAEILKEL